MTLDSGESDIINTYPCKIDGIGPVAPNANKHGDSVRRIQIPHIQKMKVA